MEKNTDTETETEQKTKKKAGGLSKNKKMWIGLAIFFVSFLLLVFGCWWLNKKAFSQNQNFVLREILIEPPQNQSGYWNALENRERRIQDISNDLSLIPGKTNLFRDDLKKLRGEFLELHPELSGVEIQRRLPDQLIFTCYERVAFLDIGPMPRDGERRYVDSSGFVFSSQRYPKGTNIPVFSYPNDSTLRNAKPGDEINSDGIQSALMLSRVIDEGYGRSMQLRKVRIISLAGIENSVTCEIFYIPDQHTYTVKMPYPLEKEKLQKYESMLAEVTAHLKKLNG